MSIIKVKTGGITADATLTSDMTTYRQALRDLPAGKDTVAKCENAVFPTKP